MEVLKWLISNGCPWDSRVWRYSAYKGHLEILKWLHMKNDKSNYTGHDGHTGICAYSSSGGHLEVVKWARTNDFEWGNTCPNAASGGHLEVLKWAISNGCPYNINECLYRAQLHKRDKIIEWLTETYLK